MIWILHTNEGRLKGGSQHGATDWGGRRQLIELCGAPGSFGEPQSSPWLQHATTCQEQLVDGSPTDAEALPGPAGPAEPEGEDALGDMILKS